MIEERQRRIERNLAGKLPVKKHGNGIRRNGFAGPRIDERIARYARIEVDRILFSQHAPGSNALIEMHKLVFGCRVDGSQQKGSRAVW